MYALLDFGDLRIEQRAKNSKVKVYYKSKIVENYESYCDAEYLDSIKNFLQGVIEQDAFAGCTNLTNVVIPYKVTNVGNYAFDECKNLTGVTIPNSVTNIGDYAFNDCTNLTNITIPDSVTSIGDCAFNGCTSLTSITIPNSIASIGSYAFNGCTLNPMPLN